MRGFLFASVLAVVACGTLAGIDQYTLGECKGGPCTPDVDEPDTGTGNEDPDAGVQPPDDSGVPCQGMRGPEAVRVGPPGNTFCIDSTEVTNADYDAFLAARVDPNTQPRECAWNTSFDRLQTDGGASAKLPAVGVDWCDARAYCEWAGKYLCGRVEASKKAGPVTTDGTSDYQTHQWMLACSAAGRLRYPYGGIHDPAKCNLADFDAGRALPVGTADECVGGYGGLHDLIGNVWEWYDSPCRADGGLEVDSGDGGPQSDACMLKGGSYLDRGAAYDCRQDSSRVRRDFASGNVGFRCCSD